MMRTPPTIAGLALTLALFGGCSPEPERSLEAPDRLQEFSDEDKRAARALSISNHQAVIDAPSPYARALLCRNAITSLAERLQQAQGPMLIEQRDAMRQASIHFEERLKVSAQLEGKTESDMRRDLDELAEQHAEPAENAQIALACLRGLQDSE